MRSRGLQSGPLPDVERPDHPFTRGALMSVVDAIWAWTALASTAAVLSLVFIARARSFGLVK
jgi:hypothetical protein